jgi:hypothetical protein
VRHAARTLGAATAGVNSVSRAPHRSWSSRFLDSRGDHR